MCHHRNRAIETIAEPAAPRGPIRVSDAERERVVDQLRAHAAAGRLEPDELEERIGGAYGARYGNDLEAVLADLPAERRLRPERRHVRPAAPPLLLAVAALVAAAAITGSWWLLWLIWPVFVVLGPNRHHHRRHRGARA
jgi:Domain of unknown function (DUF1707)